MNTEDDRLYHRILIALIAERKAGGLTEEALATRIGQSVAFVLAYESGARRIDPAEFVVIARTIGVDPYQLLAEVEQGD